MCGIAGILNFDGGPITRAAVEDMVRSIAHRGPDDTGVWTEGPIGLGHARLSIIDLSPAGHQPMHSPDGRYTVIYNGELYNYRELGARLAAEGSTFKGHSDTEVLLHAFMRWGTGAFNQFNGMFAAAIWDRREQRLTLARDRFGIKPLYYHTLPRGIIFGSEIKALLATGLVPREMNWHGLHEYLYFGNALGERTLYESVKRLLPAHFLAIDAGACSLESFWRVEDIRPSKASLEEATGEVRNRLEQAVKRHLISDVPVGVFLSGGIDSSAIAGFASKHYAGRLATYSVHFDFDPINELPKARVVAEHFKTDHHELEVAAVDLSTLIETLVRCHDEPFADPANIPLYLLCRALQGGIKVVLQGDGGDEIFAGYRRYNVLAHEGIWRAIASTAGRAGRPLASVRPLQRWFRFLETMSITDPALRLAMLMTVETLGRPPTRLFSDEARQHLAQHDPFYRYRELVPRFAHLDPVQRGLFIDSQVLLPDTFLEKVDKSTMAHSVEVRVPFLDTELADYAMSLPSDFKVHRREKKYVLRQSLRGFVPDQILDGPKTGLGVPVDEWLRGPLTGYLRSVLLDARTRQTGLFDMAALEQCIDEHVDRRRNNWYLLYKTLLLLLWHRGYAIV